MADALGLDPEATKFVESLPEEIQSVVIKQFDPSGTKDGNVMGRLLGFARSVWAKKLTDGFGASQAKEAVAMIRGYSEEVQGRIIQKFDPSGTKDGNVLARLDRFAFSVFSKLGGAKGKSQGKGGDYGRGDDYGRGGGHWDVADRHHGGKAAGRGDPHWHPLPPVDHHNGQRGYPPEQRGYPPEHRRYDDRGYQPEHRRYDDRGYPPEHRGYPPDHGYAGGNAAAEFCGRMGLHGAEADFLRSLPQEVQDIVFRSFDPKGTKDGNIWGRLFGFVRSVWVQRLGLDTGCVQLIKGLPEEAQRTVMVRFDPSRTKDGNIAARLESFARSVAGSAGAQRHAPPASSSWGHPADVRGHPPAYAPAQRAPPARWHAPPALGPLDAFVRQWDLNAEARAFLGDLPEDVSASVFRGFNAKGTKDGNIWARLFGFVRSVWAKRFDIDKEAVEHLKQMSEDAQMAVMVQFDPDQVIDGDLPTYFQALVDVDQAGWESAAPPSFGPGLEGLDAFARHYKLDDEAVSYLESLSPDTLDVVIADFDPGGTKDGNVFGRIQGFARSIENRRKRKLGGGDDPPPRRQRT